MHSIHLAGKLLDLSIPRVMGILNITPDSFYAGSRFMTLDEVLGRVESMLRDGADLVDVGAYSSRPGATKLSAVEEAERLIPMIKEISRTFPEALLSVDTFRADVARRAIDAGAHMVNDISGGALDADMFETIAELDVPYVLMHMRGTPKTMQQLTEYENIVQAISLYFGKRIASLRQLGVKDIILDPGFGFAKTLDQNFEVLSHLDEFHIFGLPLMGAISRKSMVYNALNIDATRALNGTTVLNTHLLMQGVKLLRVHDVAEAKEAITLTRLLAK